MAAVGWQLEPKNGQVPGKRTSYQRRPNAKCSGQSRSREGWNERTSIPGSERDLRGTTKAPIGSLIESRVK